MLQKNKSVEQEMTTPLRLLQVVEIATCLLGFSQICGADGNVVRTRSLPMCSSKVSSVFSARSVGLQGCTQCWFARLRQPAPRLAELPHVHAFPGVFSVLKPPFTLLDELVGQCQYETTPVHLVTLHFCIVVREDQSKFSANGLHVFVTFGANTPVTRKYYFCHDLQGLTVPDAPRAVWVFLPERLFSDRNHHCWRQTLPWRKNVVPAKLSANGSHVTPFLSNIECALNTRKKLFTEYRVVGGTATCQEGFGRMTKKLTASVPSTMMVNCCTRRKYFIDGVKRFSCAAVLFRESVVSSPRHFCPDNMNAALTSARHCAPMPCRQPHDHDLAGL